MSGERLEGIKSDIIEVLRNTELEAQGKDLFALIEEAKELIADTVTYIETELGLTVERDCETENFGGEVDEEGWLSGYFERRYIIREIPDSYLIFTVNWRQRPEGNMVKITTDFGPI